MGACRLLLALNNNQTLNINLFSWSTLFQWTDVAHQWAEGITQFLGLVDDSYMEDFVITEVASCNRVGRVVMGVVI